MENKAILRMMLTLVLFGMLISTYYIQPVKAEPGTIIVPDQYSRIQEAINAARPGDIIFVRGGIYIENVVVNKTVSLLGENPVNTIADANSTGTAIMVTVNYVTVENFTVRNGRYAGIYLQSVRNCVVRSNNITNNGYGLYLLSSSSNSISENSITKSNYGLRLYSSSSNTISSNNITNGGYGLYLSYSPNNILKDNRMAGNRYNMDVGAFSLLTDFVNDVDTSNKVEGKPIYYWVSKNGMTVPFDAGYIALVNCEGITVQNLNLSRNSQGILLAFTKESTIIRNNMTSNEYAVELINSSNNTISENTIAESIVGLYLGSSSNNRISGNNVTKSDFHGIYLNPSSLSNIISGNNIRNGQHYGIRVDSSSGNVISGNYIENNPYGIILYYCTSLSNIISGNDIENSQYGIFLDISTNTRVYENKIANNYYTGLYISSSSNNQIYHNNLSNNTYQQLSTGGSVNAWYTVDGYEGNYWSDYIGTDTNEDGIGDTGLPWRGVDYYPLMNPYKGHNIAIANIKMNKTIICQGHIQRIDVEVTNIGSFPQTFNVTVYANTTATEKQTVFLGAGTSANVTFYWNTTDAPYGVYTISAYAAPVPMETELTDNTLTDGIVTVTTPGDVNLDGIVNVLDAAGVSAHWYPGPPLGSLGYDANFDINKDGVINILDLSIVSAYWTGPPKGPKAP